MKKNILTVLVMVATIGLVGCASAPKKMACPACSDNAHFNALKNEKIGATYHTITHVVDNTNVVVKYSVPVVTETSQSWECAFGHKIQVVK